MVPHMPKAFYTGVTVSDVPVERSLQAVVLGFVNQIFHQMGPGWHIEVLVVK